MECRGSVQSLYYLLSISSDPVLSGFTCLESHTGRSRSIKTSSSILGHIIKVADNLAVLLLKHMRVASLLPAYRGEKTKSEASTTHAMPSDGAVALREYLGDVEFQSDALAGNHQQRRHRNRSPPRYDSADMERVLLQSMAEFQSTLDRFQGRRRRHQGQGIAHMTLQEAVNPSRPSVNVSAALEDAIAKLPKARVLPMDKTRFAPDATECGVCCDRLINGVVILRMPCGHLCHHVHATAWFRRSNTYPECRYELPTHYPSFEKGRIERMKDRPIVNCNCLLSGMHSRFFVDS